MIKKYFIALLAALSLGNFSFISSVYAQSPRVSIPDFADLVEKASPAVVNIRTTEKVVVQQAQGGFPGMPDDQAEFFRRFFGVPIPGIPSAPKQPPANQGQPQEADRGVGSGFIFDANGLILTNAHVVEGASTIYVTLTDKREFKAKLLGLDKRTDVAVVKIEAHDLPKLPLGDSSKVRVGEWVLAIGSPFGLENSVTAGIVSAKSRDTGDYLPFIQTDVAVNPGNSGGPLLNTAGQVIGINSQIFSRSGGYMGISFAIPIDEAMRVADQLRTNGKLVRGKIGVALGDMTKEVAESLGLGKPRGAYVRNVEPGGPAALGGIESGDVILSFHGKEIAKSTDLPRLVGETKPGTAVNVQVWRKGSTRDLTVTVGGDSEVAATASKKPEAGSAAGGSANALGVSVGELSDARKKELNIHGGVEVIGINDGALARSGVRPGDVIVRIADVDISGVKQFESLVKGLDSNKAVPVFVRRADSTLIIPVRPK
ncbi:serine protease Do [Polynucleobacter sphagniphilus]|uniref:Probable periplasmic serine endoprotease DegP-like n=1 Tax=Polynucleobacter sphagniphilus TaxID=1743169 RepID=A0AA43S4G3_9BURK|nr:DegQ family serine endoprotease [Polynucleobacter sphagniphilus]MDF9787462.1 serine protease Do [Polynucleobacter sphagniphilus]MDH6248262.1 serine protease Do [Polynucleobacter sphagniphilus]MDH6302134.1 serine protease Do [Polynucleobacter sphagniphilus]MDH6503335.1 serine protease Do [Polynucleobacter sphagniphilus]MDH6511838.1 serine protease Do [Polynucleobacter sphagniphilus]